MDKLARDEGTQARIRRRVDDPRDAEIDRDSVYLRIRAYAIPMVDHEAPFLGETQQGRPYGVPLGRRHPAARSREAYVDDHRTKPVGRTTKRPSAFSRRGSRSAHFGDPGANTPPQASGVAKYSSA